MTYKVDGIYSNERGFWTSKEWFAKQGEIRLIDGELYRFGWRIGLLCAWYPVTYHYCERAKEKKKCNGSLRK